MTAFAIIAAVLVAAALAWVLVPLLRRGDAHAGPLREASNLAVLRHQLAEAQADRNAGALSEEQYRQARAEIERRVLEEAADASPQAALTRRSGRGIAAAVGIALPLIALALYFRLGSPDALAPRQPAAEQPVTPAQIESMAGRLAARLEREPNDAQGWKVLALSYYAVQRFPEAARAYARLAELAPDDAGVLADHADALAMALGRRIAGEPLALAKRALELDPGQWKALALVASEAFARKDYRAAIGHWETLRAAAPPDSETAKAVTGYIAHARQLAGSAAPEE